MPPECEAVEMSRTGVPQESTTDQAPDGDELSEADGLRVAMRTLASGVVSVTTWWCDRPWSVTVSSCCAISLEPPTVLIALRADTVAAKAIGEHGYFGLNILSQAQMHVAVAGSAPGAAKFAEDFCGRSTEESPSPVITGALAHIHSVVERSVEAGDHIIFLAVVERVILSTGASQSPLVYCSQGYHRLQSSRDYPLIGGDADSIPQCAVW
jgi:flavin reductase (DIM6/NTAB) family NADH-FMN oxidoreductase RutF